MFEQKTGVWCDFNDGEREAFETILDLADRHVNEVPGRKDRDYTLLMVSELRRVFELPRDRFTKEAVRAQLADRRKDSHVSRAVVRCVRNECVETVEANAQMTAWGQARLQGWKLVNPDDLTSLGLVCPAHAKELGKTE